MRIKKSIVSIFLVLTCILVFTSCSSSDSDFTSDDAISLARAEVPESAEFKGDRNDDDMFEILFEDEENQMRYSVKVNKALQEVSKIEGESTVFSFGNTVSIEDIDVKKILEKNFPGASHITITLDHDHGLYLYEADFSFKEGYGEAEINAETGSVVEFTIHKTEKVVLPEDSSAENSLTSEQAADAALSKAGGGIVTDIDLEYEDGIYYYEVEIVRDGMEYDYKIDALTGEIYKETQFEQFFENTITAPETYSDEAFITREQAEAIALENSPGSSVYKVERERENGKVFYEIETRDSDFEYEFEIDGGTGKIISFEKDIID